MSEHLYWRYTTKRFDSSKRIPEEEFQSLLEVLRLSPSSYGLQPWKFVIVDDKDKRLRIKECAWGQPQVTEASHLLVLCARTSISPEYIRKHIQIIALTRALDIHVLKNYEHNMQEFVQSQNSQELISWIKRQLYIPLGMLLAECAHRKIDASPMEGFDVVRVNRELELEKEDVTAVALCALGYRSEDDRYASMSKVRFDSKDVFLFR